MKNSIWVVALIIVCAFVGPTNAIASPDVELEGFAWASTVGWISMNCSNPILPLYPNGTCGSAGGHDYSVVINTDTDEVTGHAWSPNAGWIQFGGLSDFPTIGTATVNDNVEVVGVVSETTNFSFTGWARACAATDGGDCSSMTTDTNAGGWDGWISMGGSYGAGNYGVVFQNGEAEDTAFAWGGPNTMGWIDFSPDDGTGLIPIVKLEEIPDIVVGPVGFNPGTIQADGTYDTITFNPVVTGIPDGETVDWDLYVDGILTETGTTTGGTPDPVYDRPVALTNVPAGISQLIRFEVDMPESASQVKETDEVNFYEFPLSVAYPSPTRFEITGPDVVRAGASASIDWDILAAYDMTCTMQGPGFTGEPFASISVIANTPSNGPLPSSNLSNAARFVLTCNIPGDVFTDTWQVEVIPTFQEI